MLHNSRDEIDAFLHSNGKVVNLFNYDVRLTCWHS